MWIRWLDKAWSEFQASAEPDELVSNSNPILIAGSTGVPVAALFLLAYFPPLRRLSQLENAWLASSLFTVGGVLTYIAWSRKCRGRIGTLATLLDNSFYSAGLALAAASAAEATGIALALTHGLMVVSFPARDYALTWLFAIAMTLPVVCVIAFVPIGLPVAIILLAGLAMTLVVSQETRVKRVDRLRRLRLEQALGVANRLADESVQAALTTTLLTLGHFLHELRNYQTAIAANLEYVEAAGELPQGPRKALDDAQAAQAQQAELLRKTIEELRSRSRGDGGEFRLRQSLEGFVELGQSVELVVSGSGEYEISGNSEHMRIVMLNLVRNAAQAGARRVECYLQADASGSSVRLTVSDDGSGIPSERRGTLFDSFALSDKKGGSGLGLYLIRRYIELLGGTIRVDDEGLRGGTSFTIVLPARVVGSESESRKIAERAPLLATQS